MPPSQRHLAVKSTAGIATPPPINTAEQPTLSARERLRLHVQRNLQAQEQKARQLAEQQAAAACSGIPVLPTSQPTAKSNVRALNTHQSASIQSLYAPIQDTRLGLSDITEEDAPEIILAPCILPEANVAVAAASEGFAPLNTSDLGADIGLEPGGESPPEFGDTPPYEQEGEWSVSASSLGHSHPAHLGQVGDEEWVEALIDMPAGKE